MQLSEQPAALSARESKQLHAGLHAGIVQPGLAIESDSPLRLHLQPQAPSAQVLGPQPHHVIQTASHSTIEAQAKRSQRFLHFGIRFWLLV